MDGDGPLNKEDAVCQDPASSHQAQIELGGDVLLGGEVLEMVSWSPFDPTVAAPHRILPDRHVLRQGHQTLWWCGVSAEFRSTLKTSMRDIRQLGTFFVFALDERDASARILAAAERKFKGRYVNYQLEYLLDGPGPYEVELAS